MNINVFLRGIVDVLIEITRLRMVVYKINLLYEFKRILKRNSRYIN